MDRNKKRVKSLLILNLRSVKIMIGKTELLIGGVGAVATLPRFHRNGLGRALMHQLHKVLKLKFVPFGYLQCRQAVVDFYVRVGWHLVTQPSSYIDPDANEMTNYIGPKLIMPVCATLDEWPTTGIINLRGMPW